MKNPQYFSPHKFLLILAIPLLFIACKEVQPVSVTEIEDAKLSSASQKNIELEFSLKIRNPNSFGFYIYPSSMDVKLNQISLGNAELAHKVYINANSENIYQFNVKSNSLNTISGAATVLSIALKRSAMIELHGNIKAGRFPVKKTFPIDFKKDVSLENN